MGRRVDGHLIIIHGFTAFLNFLKVAEKAMSSGSMLNNLLPLYIKLYLDII